MRFENILANSKLEVQVEADGTSIVLDNKKERSELTLTTKKGQNYGKFTCKVDNGVGKIEKTIEVVRIGKFDFQDTFTLCSFYGEHREIDLFIMRAQGSHVLCTLLSNNAIS